MSVISSANKLILAFIVLISWSFNVFAHEVKAGPNGGPITDLGEIHLELVMKADKIDLFVTDAKGDPVNVAGSSANVIILAGTKKHSAKLTPVADSILGSSFSITDAGPYTVVVIVSIPGKKPYQGRFKVAELIAFLGEKPLGQIS